MDGILFYMVDHHPSPSPSIFSYLYHGTIRFFAHHKTYTAFLFVMVSAITLYGVFSAPKVTGETVTVTRGTIEQYVRVSGHVESSKDANLSFQTAGQVADVLVKTGDAVTQGKVLATLSGGDQQAALLQAEASLSNTQAVLEQLQQGARKEEVALKEQAFENAKSSLDQAYSTLPDAIQNVDATTADVIKNKFSSLFTLANGRYQLSFSSCNQFLQGDLELKRTKLEDILAAYQTKSTVITTLSSIHNVDATFEQGYQAAIATNELVNGVSNLLLTPCSVANQSLDGYRTTLSIVKTTMTALFSDISLKRNALISAKNIVNQAHADLMLTQAGTDPYRIKAQVALVSQAEAQVAAAKSGLAKTVIRAPFSGVISNIDLSLGETVTAGKTVISMLAVNSFEIDAKVPEVDLVKVRVGAPVNVTLDAYGKDTIFPATVTRINPTATTEGTVPVYKVIITLTGTDNRVRQGMTANVEIVAESKIQIIVIPARFVKVQTNEIGTVKLLVNGKEEERTISLGIRGANGLIEVIGGLIGGEVLIPPITTTRQAQKQTS